MPGLVGGITPAAKTVLVVGESGLIGRRVVQTLRAGGRPVRCRARDPAKLDDLAKLGCEPGMVASQARKRVAVGLGGRQRMRGIATDGLVHYLEGVLDDPRSYGCRYDVGNDDVLTNSEMVDVAAEVLGRGRPVKLKMPPKLPGVLAPVIERMGKLPRGAIGGLVDGLDGDASGDPTPIRAILPRPLPTFRQAAKRASTQG